PESEAQAFAATMQQKAQDAIAQRGKGLDQAKTELLQVLFLADNAVFNVPEPQVKAKLPEDKKKQLNQLSEALAKEQKAAAAKALPIAHGVAETTPANMKVFIRGN